MSSNLRQSDIDKLFGDIDSLGFKFPVASLAESLEFSKATVSRYLSSRKPSIKFYNKFYRVYPGGQFEKISSKYLVPGDRASLLHLVEVLVELETAVDAIKKRINVLTSPVSVIEPSTDQIFD